MLKLIKLLLVVYTAICIFVPNSFSASSLVAYWDMNEISDGDMITDKSGNNNHAYIKGVLGTLPLAEGKIGNSLFFDGTGDGYLLVSQSPKLNNLKEFTIIGYVKYIDLYGVDGNTGSYPTFINRNTDDNYPSFWLFPGFMKSEAWSYEKLTCRAGKINKNNEIWTASEEKLKWEKNQWYCIAASFSKDGTMTLYRDGRETCRKQFPQNYNFGNKDIFIGSYQGKKSYHAMKGYIDEVKIFNSALSGNEIQNLYKTDGTRTIPRLAAPAPDGTPKEEFWKKCAVIDSFKSPSAGSVQKDTKVYACYDNENLYVAFKCSDSNISKIKANCSSNDGPIWQDDCVELFIDTGLGDNTYYQLLVNSKAIKAEAISSGQGLSMNWEWNTDWKVGANTFDNYWIAEMLIPLKGFMHSNKIEGQEIRISANREETEFKEKTGWPSGYFHNPAEFGSFILGNYNDNLLKTLAQIDSSIKQYEPQILKLPPDDEKEKLDQDLKNLKEKVNDCISSLSSSKIATLTEWEEKKIEIRILDTQSKDISNRLILYSLNQSSSDSNNLKSALAKIDFDLLAKSIDLQTDKNAAKTFKTLLKSLYDSDFFLYRKSPWTNWENDKISILPLQKPILQNIELTMGINGYETVSMVLENFDDKSKRFTVKSESNAIKVTIRTSRFIPTIIGKNVSDPLPLLENPIAVDALRSREIWITVNTNMTKPDDYKIPVSITSAENKTMTVNLLVKVIPVEIPKQPKDMPFYTYIWDYCDKLDTALQTEAKNDLLSHYITVPFLSPSTVPWPTGNGTIDFKKCDERLKLWTDGNFKLIGWYWNFRFSESGQQARFGRNFMNDKWKENFTKWYQAFLNHLKEKGLDTDKYFFHIFDETTCPEAKELAIFLKKINPQVRLYLNPATKFSPDEIESFNPYIDIWSPYFYGLMKAPEKERVIDAMKTKGEFFWGYFNCEGGLPQCSSAYTAYRLIPWLAWKNKIQGMGNWVYLYNPDLSWSASKAGRSYSWDIVYLSKYAPADISRKEGIIPSKRWEAWREGAEDFLLLSILKDTITKSETENADSPLLIQAKKCLEKWPDIVLKNKKNIDMADKARSDIINNIVLLQTELKKLK